MKLHAYCRHCGDLTRTKRLAECEGCGALLCPTCYAAHDAPACLAASIDAEMQFQRDIRED